MGMSTHVVGIKPPDDKWKNMKAVWDACLAAGIEPPPKVSKFFNDEVPDSSGVRVELDDHPSVHRWTADMQEGVEVDVKRLPADVVVVRFYNSW
jgi:hypothetical protein